MSMTKTKWGAVVALLVLLAASPAVAAEDLEFPFDEWLAVFMQGNRVGYIHMEAALDEDIITSSTVTQFKLRRFGTDVSIQMEAAFRERTDGTPLSFTMTQDTGGMGLRTEGTVRDGMLHLVTVQGERRRERNVKWPEGALTPFAVERQMRGLELEPGVEFTVKAFSPDVSMTKAVETTIKVIGPDTVDVLGIEHQAVKVETQMSALPGITVTTWLDNSGNVLVITMPIMDMRAVRCTKQYALAEIKPAELAGTIMVKPDKRIKSPQRLKRLVLRLSMEDSSPFAVTLASEGHQRLVKRDEQSATIEISLDAAASKLDDPEPYLARSTYIDCEDKRIVAVAADAAGNESGPWRKAQLLRSAVYDLVEEKSFAVAMATASEVVKTKEGDCTEHAVLLAAMARAEEIPTRVTTGLMYVQGQFGYHMWTEVYVDGAWRGLDAVLPGRDFDAAHIRLATSAFGDDDSMLDLAAFAVVFGNLKIEVVEKEYAKRARNE